MAGFGDRPTRTTALGYLSLAVGAALVVGGVVIWQFVASGPASVGWFAYAPLDTNVSPPSMVVLDRSRLIAAALVVLGLLWIAFLLGVRRGSRRAR